MFLKTLEKLTPMERTVASNIPIYGSSTQFIDLSATQVLGIAVPLIESGKFSRADAVSMCYDALLAQHGEKRWKRTGEVVILETDDVARALCYRVEEGEGG